MCWLSILIAFFSLNNEDEFFDVQIHKLVYKFLVANSGSDYRDFFDILITSTWLVTTTQRTHYQYITATSSIR